MKYEGYSATDFANDTYFIHWVKSPDAESDWFWQSFMRENPASRPAIEEARMLLSLLEFPEKDFPHAKQARIKNRLLMAVHADKEAAKDSGSLNSGSFRQIRRRWLNLAAAVLIIPLVSTGIFLFLKKNHDANGNLSAQSAKDGFTKRENPSGQKSVLFLADGTKVWLNAASEISYAANFMTSGTRDVYLEGEAFFDVAHNKDRPFIVHTSSMKIKVVGTSFNVKSYADEKTIQATLLKGKVRIEPLDVTGARMADIELKPNQQAVFDKASRIINIKEVVAEHSASWRQERMVFDEEPLDNVILQLERWYDIKIHVANRGNLDCKLTATIGKESLEEVLKLMEGSHDIKYRIVGSEVFIDGTLCKMDQANGQGNK